MDPISAALTIGSQLIDRLWADPAQRDAAKLELLKLQQSGELAQLTAETDIAKGQAAINQAEAANPSLFVSAWRPSVGWCCSAGLAIQFLIAPTATFIAGLLGHAIVFPTLDMGTLMTLLLGMLGLGSLRTAEKFKGVAK